MSRPSVLVTSGAGYSGSHAVKALAAGGIRIVAFDNMSAGHPQAVRHASGVVVGDIHETARLRATIREDDVDVIARTAWRWREAHAHRYRKATA